MKGGIATSAGNGIGSIKSHTRKPPPHGLYNRAAVRTLIWVLLIGAVAPNNTYNKTGYTKDN